MSKIIINGIDVSDYQTVDIPDHAELTIKYADGSVKTVDYTAAYKAKTGTEVRTLAGSFLSQIKAAYAAAGHEVIEVRNVMRTKTLSRGELEHIAAEIAADRDYDAYRAHHNAVAGASAGGEPHDTI